MSPIATTIQVCDGTKANPLLNHLTFPQAGPGVPLPENRPLPSVPGTMATVTHLTMTKKKTTMMMPVRPRTASCHCHLPPCACP